MHKKWSVPFSTRCAPIRQRKGLATEPEKLTKLVFKPHNQLGDHQETPWAEPITESRRWKKRGTHLPEQARVCVWRGAEPAHSRLPCQAGCHSLLSWGEVTIHGRNSAQWNSWGWRREEVSQEIQLGRQACPQLFWDTQQPWLPAWHGL